MLTTNVSLRESCVTLVARSAFANVKNRVLGAFPRRKRKTLVDSRKLWQTRLRNARNAQSAIINPFHNVNW